MWGITQAIYSTACNNDASVSELNRLWFGLNHGAHSFKRSRFERRWNVRSLKNETCLHPQQKQILTINGLSDWIFFFFLSSGKWYRCRQRVPFIPRERMELLCGGRHEQRFFFFFSASALSWSESRVNKASDECADRPAVADASSARLLTYSLAFRCGRRSSGVSKRIIIQKTFFSEVRLCLSADCTLDALSTCDWRQINLGMIVTSKSSCLMLFILGLWALIPKFLSSKWMLK